MKKKRYLNRNGWFFVFFAAALMFLFYFYPVIYAARLSLMSGKGNGLTFSGTANFLRMLKDTTLKKAFLNTLLYLMIQVPIMLVLGLIISSILQNKRIRFKGFFRTALFLPCITSSVAYSLIFKSIFASEGIMNQLLVNSGLIKAPIMWLNDPLWAKVLIIIVITWRWTGYNAIFYIAGLQNIDQQIYEAAEIDGANGFHRLMHISIPILKPIILFTSITSTVGTLQLFDEVHNITNGGPGNATLTISQYVYHLCFRYVPEFGYAAAICLVVAMIIAVLSALQMKAGGRE